MNAETLAEARPLLDEANGKNQTYLILTYAGAAVLAGDALLYWLRRKRYLRDLENYNRYCGEGSLSLRPLIATPLPGLSQTAAGLKLTLTF